MKRAIYRAIVIWLITGVSLLVPDFTDFLNIAGSIGSAVIAFILPPLLYMVEFKGQLSLPSIIFQWFIIVFGAAGATYSTVYSILKIIRGDTS